MTRSLPRCALLLALLALPIIGCNTVQDATGGAGGTAGTGGVAGTGGTGGTAGTPGAGGVSGNGGNGGNGGGHAVSLAAFVVEFQGEGVPFTPLEGVEICETDTSNCVLTDANGEATIMLPADREISYTLKKEGYLPWLVADVLDESFDGDIWFPMYSDEISGEVFDNLMSPYPQRGTGSISLQVLPNFAGVTFDLIGATGKAYYAINAANLRTDLEATTADGNGGFVEVGPGEYEVEFGGTASGRGNCTRSYGWPSQENNRIRIPVREGYTSYGSMNCPQNTVPLGMFITESDWETPLEGVTLCQTDTANCALTNAEGRATIDLPFNQEVSYTLEKEGYGPYLIGNFTGGDKSNFFPMYTDEELVERYDGLMTPYPERGTGSILLDPFCRKAGRTFDLIDATGKEFYFDDATTPSTASLDLDATTSTGIGGFVEVTPGEFQVEFGGTATDCVPGIAWPSDEDNRIRVEVREGYTSYGSMTCDPGPCGTGGGGGAGGEGGVGGG